jgi:ParB-like chromosome segregation protein Spo0J
MEDTYEIIDGVRRAKALQIAGGRTIRARLYVNTLERFRVK